MVKIKKILLIQLLCFVPFIYSTSTLASSWYKEASLGVGYSNIKHDQDVTLFQTPSEVTNRYTSDGDDQSIFYASIGGGRSFTIIDNVNIDLGLEGIFIDYDKVNGTVHPFFNDDPNYSGVGYSYKPQSYLLFTKSRFTYKRKGWQPFIDVGIGLALNVLKDYEEHGLSGSDGDAAKNSTYPQDTLDISDANLVAAGQFQTCAVVNGWVKCWGYNGSGQLGDNSTENSNIPVFSVGINNIGFLSNVIDLAPGPMGEHICAIINE